MTHILIKNKRRRNNNNIFNHLCVHLYKDQGLKLLLKEKAARSKEVTLEIINKCFLSPKSDMDMSWYDILLVIFE